MKLSTQSFAFVVQRPKPKNVKPKGILAVLEKNFFENSKSKN